MRKKKIPQLTSPRFASRLSSHVNTLLVLRYQENKRVHEVLEYLRNNGVPTTAQNFHSFMRRVLHLMPHSEAARLKVDAALLRAVRVRLKMPTDPKGIRVVVGKPTERYDSRTRRRRLQTVPKAKRSVAASTATTPIRRERVSDANQLPLAGIVMAAEKPGLDQLTGDVNNPDTLTRADWKIINEMAHSKLRAIDRKIYPNQQGRVLHLTTRIEYTRADLVKEYGLTPTEAESCFLTL